MAAYVVIFLFAFAEATAVIGLVVPGTTVVAAAGSAAELGKLSYWAVVWAAALGAFSGDALSYGMGAWMQRLPRIERWSWKHRAKAARAEAALKKWGMLAVIAGRFFAPTRAFIPLLAGAARMPLWKFTLANAVGAVAWAWVTVEIGEKGLEWYEHLPRRWGLAAIAAALTAWLLWRLYRRATSPAHE
jgi:membrane protein DedA with SNARE-associated domain